MIAAAVVSMPHEKWGETPCAFVELNDNNSVNEDELSQWCRDNMASYKLPRKFIFEEIPKTSTGKVQKFTLRDRVRNGNI